MTWVNVSIPDGATGRRCGESMDVLVEWEFDGAVSALELKLCWTTESPNGSPEPVVVKTERIEPTEAKGSRTVRLELPDSPWSFVGKLFLLQWYVEFGTTEWITRKADFVLSPNGSPIRTRPESPEPPGPGSV